MSELKDSWKGVGHNFSQAWKGLGKSIVKSVSTGAKKADEWANGAPPEQQNQQTTQQTQTINAEGVEINTEE